MFEPCLLGNKTTTIRFTLPLSQVEFSVDIIGTPPPDVTWYKDGFEVYDTQRFQFLADGDRYMLILREARLTDEGDIRVRATNRVGVASSQAALAVQGTVEHVC